MHALRRIVFPSLLALIAAGCDNTKAPVPTCGNGSLDPGETCDPRSTNPCNPRLHYESAPRLDGTAIGHGLIGGLQ